MQAFKKLAFRSNMTPLFQFSSFKTNPPHLIEPQDAKQFTNDSQVKFLDVRDIKEFEQQHIDANTCSGDMFFWYRSGSDAQEIKKMSDVLAEYLVNMGVNKDDYVIAYEQQLNQRKGASCRAFYLLELLGHKNVSVLNGGYDKWLKLGYGVTSEIRQLPKGNFTAGWNKEIWACQNQVLQSLKANNRTLIDVRDHDEWKGDSSSPLGKDFVSRKGRIQGAKWVFWEDLMSEKDGIAQFNSSEQIRKQMAEVGVTDLSQPLTIYCFKGARASNTYLALKQAGFTDVNNYFASWNEWAENHELPIDSNLL